MGLLYFLGLQVVYDTSLIIHMPTAEHEAEQHTKGKMQESSRFFKGKLASGHLKQKVFSLFYQLSCHIDRN